MGDSLVNDGGMWDVFDLALQTSPFGTAAAGAPAGALTPMPSTPSAPMGNSGIVSSNTPGESPTHFVIKRLGPASRTVVTRLPFKNGLSLRHYITQARLDHLLLSLVPAVNGRRVHISYVPRPGDELTLAPPDRPGIQLRIG